MSEWTWSTVEGGDLNRGLGWINGGRLVVGEKLVGGNEGKQGIASNDHEGNCDGCGGFVAESAEGRTS